MRLLIFLVVFMLKGIVSQNHPLMKVKYDKLPNIFPWSATVLEGWTPLCSAAIIDDKNLLTSALCCQIIKRKNVKIRVGSDNLGLYGTKVNFKDCICHEYYNGYTGQNDIAIIKLTNKLEFNERIQRVNLPRSGFIPAINTTGIFPIWQPKSHDTTPSYKILPAKFKIVKSTTCVNPRDWQPFPSFHSIPFRGPVLVGIIENILCVDVVSTHIHNCKAAIGASFVANNVIVGISSSFIAHCANNKQSLISTNIHEYLEWIEENKQK